MAHRVADRGTWFSCHGLPASEDILYSTTPVNSFPDLNAACSCAETFFIPSLVSGWMEVFSIPIQEMANDAIRDRRSPEDSPARITKRAKSGTYDDGLITDSNHAVG
jgi:hypothetical protein